MKCTFYIMNTVEEKISLPPHFLSGEVLICCPLAGLCVSVLCVDHDFWPDVEPHQRTALRTQEPQHWANCKAQAHHLHSIIFTIQYVNEQSDIEMCVCRVMSMVAVKPSSWPKHTSFCFSVSLSFIKFSYFHCYQ